MSAARRGSSVVVVGAGVIGLTAAWRLSEAGYAVRLWSRDDALATTSSVAAAIWYPFLAEPRDRVLGWSRRTFERLAELAREPGSGVRMQRVVEVFATAAPDLWWRTAVPHLERLPAHEVPPPYAAAIRLEVPVCDVPIHLPWLIGELARRGVVVERRTVSSFDEAFAVADTVVNCTGLGAAELCGDRELQPVRGQVLLCAGADVPTAWVDDTSERPIYLIPRRDGVVVGGTAQVGDPRLAADPADSQAILAAATRRFPQLRQADVRAVRVGLRPYRSSVRLEVVALADGRRLVHDYGHGGSGWTLAWGCADEVVALLGG